MAAKWDDLGRGPWSPDARVPHESPDSATRRRLGLPSTLRPVAGAVQRAVFDPALRHFPRAMRAGEPRFASAEQHARWYAARRRAVDHVLAALADSPWVDELMLRGSVLLRAWYGGLAREPGDLDFVVLPPSWSVRSHRTSQLMDDIAEGAERQSGDDNVRVSARSAVVEDIWSYDPCPGRRLLLTWKADRLPYGTVQLDFVFGEDPPAPPEPTEIPRADGGEPVLLNAATPELSLAWKLRWLVDDVHPQGKDLYDAWLLARHVTPSLSLLKDTIVAARPAFGRRWLTADDIAGLDVDWREFRKDYPDVPGTAARYLAELADALAPVLAEPR